MMMWGRLGAVLMAVAMVSLGFLTLVPMGSGAPPQPHTFYGSAYGAGAPPDPLQENETITAWVDGVDYSNRTLSRAGGAYDLDVFGNWYTNLSNPNTPDIKEGADMGDAILFMHGDMTDVGRVFTETVPWSTGDLTPLDLHEATEQPALLKVGCLELRSTFMEQRAWVHNPSPSTVDLSLYYLKKDGLGPTNYSAWSMPLSGVLPSGASAAFVLGGSPVSATGDDIEIVYGNPGLGFGGNDLVVDRVEWNETGGYGTHYWEASNTLMSDASLTPSESAIWRLGFPGSSLQDTNSNAVDFAAGASCPTTPPDLPPAPPTMRPALLSGSGWVDVTVRWDLSPDDGSGENDVVGYEIWTGPVYDGSAATYSLLAAVGPGTTTYVHVGAGGTGDHFYQVRAVEDVSARFTSAVEQSGKVAQSLVAGKRLISVPLEQEDGSVGSVLQTISWSRARTYGKISGHGHNWHSNDQGRPWKDLTTLDRKMAVWVEVSSSGTWAVAGLVPAFTSITLEVGWNFLGYPSFTAKTVAQLLAGISYQTVEGYADDPPHYLRRLNASDVMSAGNGYWVHISGNPATLVFTN